MFWHKPKPPIERSLIPLVIKMYKDIKDLKQDIKILQRVVQGGDPTNLQVGTSTTT